MINHLIMGLMPPLPAFTIAKSQSQSQWNNIVDWATDVINGNSLQKGVLCIRYYDGCLIPRILGIADKQAVVFDGGRIEMTKEEIETLSEAGIITKPELEALLRGEEISTVINPK